MNKIPVYEEVISIIKNKIEKLKENVKNLDAEKNEHHKHIQSLLWAEESALTELMQELDQKIIDELRKS